MNYAFMSFSTPELTLPEMLAYAKATGYAALEPRIDSNHKHGIELDTNSVARSKARELSSQAGVALGCIATSCRYSDPANSEAARGLTIRCIDLAHDVGSPRLRVFGGEIPEGVTRSESADAIVESLKAVAEHAARKGVIICMETHDAWCNPSDVADILRRIDHPNIAVNWDIMHPVLRGDSAMGAAFSTLRPWIKHVHIHDGTGDNFLPIGEGNIDHHAALVCLNEMGYDGLISGEWINWEDAYDTHLPRELATMKKYEQAICSH